MSCTDFCKNSGLSSMDQQRAEKKVKIGACLRFPKGAISSLHTMTLHIASSSYLSQKQIVLALGDSFHNFHLSRPSHSLLLLLPLAELVYNMIQVHWQTRTEIIRSIVPVYSTMLTMSFKFLFLPKGSTLSSWVPFHTYIFHMLGKEVSLYIDNQALIYALSSRKSTSGQHLVKAFRDAANDLHCGLTIRWISSHSDIKGNEAADKLAKEAATGRSSRRIDLPHALRGQLPASTSATKQEFHENIKQLWQKTWTESPRRVRFSQIDANFPFNRFRTNLFKLTRQQASLIMQIRTGHIPLNKHLRRIMKADSDKCPKCNTRPGDNPVVESVNHFVFDCTAHEVARRELIAKTGRRHFNLSDIMTSTDNMKALVMYINRTRRLKDEQG